MKRIIINAGIMLQVLFLTSCLTTKQTNLFQKPGADVPSYPSINIPVEEYRIKSGDQLLIAITSNPMDQSTTKLFSYFSMTTLNYEGGGEEGSSRSFPVTVDGAINFPYLGNIYVKGKTTLEIQHLIEKRLHENISEDCFVRVFLDNRYYSVIGEASTGKYPIAKEQMTIYQALAQSGEIRPYGDRRQVKIIRQMDGGTMIKAFDLRSKDIVNSEFYYIQPNDVIYIQPLGREFLGFSSFGAAFTVISTVISLGVMIYKFLN